MLSRLQKKSMSRRNPNGVPQIHATEPATIGRATPEELGVSESVAQADNERGVGYKRICNELCAPTP